MAGKLYKKYKEEQGTGGSSLYQQYKTAMQTGLPSGDERMDRYVEHRRQMEEEAQERKKLRNDRINRENRERQLKNKEINKERATATDFMRQERETLQKEHEFVNPRTLRYEAAHSKMRRDAEARRKKREDDRKKYEIQKSLDAKGVMEHGIFNDALTHFTPYEKIMERPDFKSGAFQGANDQANPMNVWNEVNNAKTNLAAELTRKGHSYQAMTDNEKSLYNYLFSRYGVETATRYVNSLDDELNIRIGNQLAQSTEKRNPIAAFGTNMLTSLAAGTGRAIKGIGQAANMITGNYETEPITKMDAYLNHLQEKSSGAEKIAYDLANSTGFMLPSMFVVGPAVSALAGTTAGAVAGSAMFGAAAGGNSYVDSIKEGQDIESAQMYGAWNAMSETATQYLLGGLSGLSIDRPAVKSAVDKALRKLVANPYARDVIGQVTNYGADMASEGLQEYTQELLDKASRNIFFGEDNKISATDPEAWYAAMLGALNAGVLNAPGAVAREADYRSIGKTLAPDFKAAVQELDPKLVYETKAMNRQAEDLREMVESYAKRQENGDDISNREKGRLAERFADFFENAVPVETDTQMDSEQKETVQTLEQNVQNQEEIQSNQEEIKQPQKESEAIEPEILQAPQSSENLTEEDHDFLNEISKQYGSAGMNAYLDNRDPSMDLNRYTRSFNRVYDAGRYGIKMDEAVHQEALSTLGRETLENIWKAGAQDRDRTRQNLDAKTGAPLNMTQGPERSGGLGEVADTATQQQKTVASYMGQRTGLQFNLVDGMVQDGTTASYEKGKVTLDVNSKDFLGSMGHELTHFIHEYDPDNFNEYTDQVVRAIMKSDGMDLQDGIDAYINNYMSKAGQQLTREQAVEEIVADASQKFFNDEEFIKEVTKDKTLGQKILDFINDVIDAIRSLIKTGSTRQSAKALEESEAYFQRARRAYMAGLEAASERYKAGYEIQSDSGERFKLVGKDENGIEIYETSEETKNLSLAEKKKKLKAMLLNEWRGRTAKFEKDGKVYYAQMDSKGAQKGIYGDKKSTKSGFTAKMNIGAEGNYFELLEKSRYYSSSLEQGKTTSNGAHKEIKNWDYFVKTIKSDGKVYDVLINIRDTGNDQYVYDVTLKDKKTESPGNARSALYQGDSVPSTIQDSNTSVKIKKTEPPSSARSALGQGDSVSSTIHDGKASVKTKFQLKDPVEETDTLIAVHNLNSDKLLDVLESPGIHLPSIENTKTDHGWNDFGDISLIFRNDTIDPESSIFKEKSQRVVGYDEVAAAVIPENVDDKVLNALMDRGIKSVTYNPDEENSRIKAVNSLDNIRFQMEDIEDYASESYVNQLLRENKDLREANELLKKEFTLTAKEEVRQDDIRKVCQNILKEYNSTANPATVLSNVTRLFEYIRSAENVDWKEVSEVATDVGRSILKRSQQKDTELTEQYKELRKKIRDTKIMITDQDKADLAEVGGYNDFRKKYFGKMKLGKDGISIDSIYQELSEQYPELFDIDITHPADQLMQIGNILDMTQPQVMNPYHANMDEMAYHVGQELLQEYWNVRQQIPTFADKQALELDKAKRTYKESLENYKRKVENQYNALLYDARRENENLKDYHKTELRQQADKYKQKIQNLKGKTDEYKQKIRDNRQEYRAELQWQRDQFGIKLKERRESLEKRQAKEQVIKETAKLRKWLLEPTDKNHIPEDLRTITAEFLSNIDFSSKDENVMTKRTAAWNDAVIAFDKIMKSGTITDEEGNVRFVTVDPDLGKMFAELTDKAKGIDKLENLSAYDTKQLLNTVRAVKTMITEVNSLKANLAYGKVSILAEKVFKNIEAMKDRKEYKGIAGFADSLLNVEMMDPVTVFHKIGPAAETVYHALTTGWDKKTQLLKTGEEYFLNALEECGITQQELRKWTGKTPERRKFELPGGTIELSIAQIMSLYEMDKRGQAKKHIYDKKGGIKSGGIELGVSVKEKRLLPQLEKNPTPVKVTQNDVKTITDTLTSKQKKLADKLQQFFEKNTSAWGNEVSMLMYGYEKFKASNYFPIVTDKDYIMRKEGEQKNSAVKNLGMTKSTNQNANNPVVVEDIFDVFTRQVDQMSTYNALLPALSDLHKLLNYKDARGFNNSSIQEQIKRTFGTGMARYLDKFMEDINGSVHDRGSGIADALIGNMKAAAVAGNLRVAVQQPGSIARAFAEMDGKYILRGLAKSPKWDIITKYAPIAQWKDWGFYQMQTSRRMRDVLMDTESGKERLVNKSMVLAELGDKITWKRLWGAAELEIADKYPNLKVGSEEFYKKVGERFSDVIYKTQVADSVMLRTQIMRSQNGFDKMATAFMGEPLKTYNMLYRAAWDLQSGRMDKKTSRKRAAKVGAAFAANAFLTAAAAATIDMFRDDDDEKKLDEKYKSHMVANLIDNLNILGNTPYIKDIIETAVSRGTIQRSDLQNIKNVYYSWKKVKDVMDKKGKYTPQFAFLEATRSVSSLFGIPVKNVTRDAFAIINTVVSSMGDDEKYQAKRMKYDISLKDNRSMYVEMLTDAAEAKDKVLTRKILNDLQNAGWLEEDIEDQITSNLNKEITALGISDAADAYDYKNEKTMKAFEDKVDQFIELKKKAGKKKEKALESLYNSLDSYYKDKYKHAKDQKEKDKIIEHCNRLRYNKKAIFNSSNYANWKKEKKSNLEKILGLK